MQHSITKLERVVDRLNHFYLGSIENSSQNVTTTCVMTLTANIEDLHTKMNGELPVGTKYTRAVDFIMKRVPLIVELSFTSRDTGVLCGTLHYLPVTRVINMCIERLGRTILEVNVNKTPMVLKIVNSAYKDTIDGHVQTPTEQEANSFNKIPEKLRDIFVEKYAHGRLYANDGTGDYSPEVILMNKMCEIDLQTAMSIEKNSYANKIKWWAEAMQKLLTVHECGWIHGDCYTSNLLWSNEVGVGSLKWIDPERMRECSTFGSDTKLLAAHKLHEIYHILFHTAFFGNRLIGGLSSLFQVDFCMLHQRLSSIRSELGRNGRTDMVVEFMLPDFVMFNNGNRGDAIKGITPEIMQALSKHVQYEKMDRVDYSQFLRKLTNVYYLDNVYEYLVIQTNKVLAGDMTISAEDLSIPTEIPSARMGGVGASNIQQNNSVNTVSFSGIYPLIFAVSGKICPILTPSGENYSLGRVASSPGTFHLCLKRDPAAVILNGPFPMQISTGQLYFESLPLYMTVNGSLLQITLFNQANNQVHQHKTFDLTHFAWPGTVLKL